MAPKVAVIVVVVVVVIVVIVKNILYIFMKKKPAYNHDASLFLPLSRRGFLIDGYPHDVDQAVAFEEEIRPCRVCLYLHVSAETMIARMKERLRTWGHIRGRAVVNADGVSIDWYKADDGKKAMKAIKKRVKKFLDRSKSVLDHYRKAGKLVQVHGEDQADYVFHRAVTDIKVAVERFEIFGAEAGKTSN